MLALVLTFILSVAIAFVVTLDSIPATLRFGETTLSGIPMFYVVFVSIIIGVLLASVTTIVNLITSKLTIMGKNRDLRKSYKSSDKLAQKVNKLEEEKVELKEKLKEAKTDTK